MPIVNSKGLAEFQEHSITTTTLDGGFASGEQTTAIIKKLAGEFKKDPIVRNHSVRVVSALESNDYLGEVKAIFEWVRDNIRYVRDIAYCETLQIPTVTLPRSVSPKLGVGAGDCDDHALLLASMLLSIGVRKVWARIVTYKPSDKEWKHIYIVAEVKGKLIPLDAIVKNKPFGYEVNYYSKKDIPLF